MNVEKIPYLGGWLITDMTTTHRITARYFGYTKREAVRMFRRDYL